MGKGAGAGQYAATGWGKNNGEYPREPSRWNLITILAHILDEYESTSLPLSASVS